MNYRFQDFNFLHIDTVRGTNVWVDAYCAETEEQALRIAQYNHEESETIFFVPITDVKANQLIENGF